MTLESFIEDYRYKLNDSLPDYRTVDLGFWDYRGDYQVDYQQVDLNKE